MDRRYAKRQMRAIYRTLDKAMASLILIAKGFEKTHPIEAKALRTISTVILSAQGMVVNWYEKVWGSPPSNWYIKE